MIRDSQIILRVLSGSEALGCSTGEGDRDETAVCIEDISQFVRLGQPFEQEIRRSAVERTGVKDSKSEAGDTDLTIFSLRKFCRLAANGNPSSLEVLFAPILYFRAPAGWLREMAPVFVSKEAGARYLGYMQGQRQRLLGERGQKRIKRPDLEAEYGFDTKYAYHIIRLGFQGIELMETGKLQVPIDPDRRSILTGVRSGDFSLEQVISMSDGIERDLKKARDNSKLPEHPDRPAIEEFLQRVYLETWKARQLALRPERLGFVEYTKEKLQ